MKVATIHQDQDCGSPREDDNAGIMALFHSRMNVANESGKTMDEVWQHVHSKDFKGVVLNVYCYEHGSIALSTAPFSCPWDSGQLGVIYIPQSKIDEEYGAGKDHEEVKAYLKGEVETYSQWLNGECYGYVLKECNGEDNGQDGEELDACWGYVGRDSVEEAAREAGAEEVIYSDR